MRRGLQPAARRKPAIAIFGTRLARGDTVHWNGRPLSTAYGISRFLSAVVPLELLARPGEVQVTIENATDAALPTLGAVFRLLAPDGPSQPAPTSR